MIRPSARFLRFVDRMVEISSQNPLRAVLVALLLAGALWGYASRLQLRSELRELLPRNSAEYQAYERQSARSPHGATLLVLAASPNREANLRFIASLATLLRERQQDPKMGIRVVDADNQESHAFFARNKWLYIPLQTLQDADAEIGRAIAIRSGLVEDLSGPATQAEGENNTLADLRKWREEAEQALLKLDPFPTGYYEADQGRVVGLRVISTAMGTGDGGERLFDEVKVLAERVRKNLGQPLTIGFAGDIPNAIEEKQSVSSDALWSTALATLVVLLGVVVFFRSKWSLIVIAAPVAVGVGIAYAFATAAFGYVNTAGAFLGAIIMGNGINYPIVLLARYQDFRGRGMDLAEALREAVRNAFRAELVGAAVAAIAYGSLTVTQFRGFNQFGAIGFVGMLGVWVVSIPLVPALIALGDRWAVGRSSPRGGQVLAALGGGLTRNWKPVLLGAAIFTTVVAWQLPGWFADPWEYNFARMGSRRNKAAGAGHWSKIAETVFGGKPRMAAALMVADTPEQVAGLAAAIMANDAKYPGPRMIERVLALGDLVPGSQQEQQQKIEVLARLQRRLRPDIMETLDPELQSEVRQMLPTGPLSPISTSDLPPSMTSIFRERDGTLGTVFYVQTKADVSLSNGRNLLRIDAVTNNVHLADGTVVQTASRAGVFAEIFRSLNRDGPLASMVSLLAVAVVVLIATHTRTGAFAVLGVLVLAVVWMLGFAAWTHERLNFLNFVALPITFGIGCEYPFNIFDRVRLLKGNIRGALERSGGAVALCSYTTIVGYGSLLVADNQALQSFGRLAIAGEFACILCALLVLPALLAAMQQRATYSEAGID